MGIQVEEVDAGRRWRARSVGADGTEVGAQARVGELHPSRAWLELSEDPAPDTLRDLVTALVEATGRPLAAKAVPGTARHALLTRAGATTYQVVPPSHIDCADPDNLAWAQSGMTDAPMLSDLTEVPEEIVLRHWLTIYTWLHADWSPVQDQEAARRVFAPMLGEGLLRDRSVLAQRDGVVSAVAFAFPEGEDLLVVCEAVDPDAATARQDVAACLRAAVQGAAEAGFPGVLVDGHTVDPHLYPALLEVPHRGGAGLHLLELDGAARDGAARHGPDRDSADRDRPEIVCLCGSARFADRMRVVHRDLTFAGVIVVAPGEADDVVTPEQKVALDALHRHKIDLADRVLVVNPGGYVGESTRREIAYAESTGKPVAFTDPG